MRADDRGEGGDFALWSLLKSHTGKVFGITILGYLVVTAAGLLAADGIITPPISLLGAFDPLGEFWAITINGRLPVRLCSKPNGAARAKSEGSSAGS